jgi:hypothetical protein
MAVLEEVDMHLTDGELRTYIDRETTDGEQEHISVHLGECAECQQRLKAISMRGEQVGDRLIALAPHADEEHLSIGAARARLQSRISVEKEVTNMWNKLFSRKYRPAWVAVTLILVLAVALSFPQVQAIATSFLGLFRVEQIEAVEVGISLDEMPDEMESQFMAFEQLLSSDTFQVDQEGEAYDVADAAEASSATGYPVRLPTSISGERRISYQPAATMRFTIDRALWQAIIDEMGYGFELPKSVEGKEVVVSVPQSVTTFYGDCATPAASDIQEGVEQGLATCTVFTQMPSPTIEAPPGLDVKRIGQIFLEVLGMSPEEAARFSQDTDWSTTLVIPVPEGAKYREEQVDGVSGTLFEDPHGKKSRYTLMWIKDGMFYALAGDSRISEVISIADSLE